MKLIREIEIELTAKEIRDSIRGLDPLGLLATARASIILLGYDGIRSVRELNLGPDDQDYLDTIECVLNSINRCDCTNGSDVVISPDGTVDKGNPT